MDERTRARFSRRSVLGFMGTGAIAVAAPGALSACSSSGGGSAPAATGPISAADLARILPAYQPLDLVQPDIPGVDGSTPGFTTMPARLVKSVAATPGKGGTYTVMSPAWWTPPPGLGSNTFYQAVNEQLGATLDFQVADGNTYGDKLQAVLASPKDIADWVVMPSWNIPPRFGQGVGKLFTDLTDFLAGDKIKKYPNLANIPTDAWKYSAFNGRIYALPYPGELIGNAIFHRRDIFEQLGLQPPTTPEEYIAVAKAATDPAAGRWGSEDVWNGAQFIFNASTDWYVQGGKLVSRFETDGYREAVAWLRQLFESGAVHPDAVAGNTQNAKDRFEAGQTLLTFDGLGGWEEALTRVRPSNPSYDQQPLDFFAPAGQEPRIPKGAPAGIFSFLKRTDDTARIEEMLAIADFCAAPFGTEEYQLVRYGVEGEHFTRDAAGAPTLNAKGQTEVTSTYEFLVSPPIVNATVQFPDMVRDLTDWMARMSTFSVEPVFYGQQIQDPAQYSSLGKPFDDLVKDIARGREDLDALDEAVKTWRSSGGDELRAYREKFLTGDETEI
ncbi:extracellular solute-binding protein [Kineococcus glutinatus]|uniref:Extracellular solute-binding protein n=1 Tax=Kineococcus glutinatus TaxID=1070872 RepID=A0ABP9HZE6_9ACTN